MRTDVVFTLTGADRVGIVEDVTKTLLELGGNVDASRMSRLGGEFAMLMLVSLPTEKVETLDESFAVLTEQGYKVTTTPTHGPSAEAREGWSAYRVEVIGADHEGIVHDIAAGLSEQGISIESAETRIVAAPITGAPLFTMTALVLVPEALVEAEWLAALDEAGRRANVDIEVAAEE